MESRAKVEKEVNGYEKQVVELGEQIETALETDDYQKAERLKSKQVTASNQVDLRRQRLQFIIRKEEEAAEKDLARRAKALEDEIETLDEMLEKNNQASIAVFAFWQGLANRAGRGASDGTWSQEEENGLKKAIAELQKEIAPALSAIDFHGADSLEGRRGEVVREIRSFETKVGK